MTTQEKELKLFLVKNLKTYFNLISQTDTFINDLAKAIIAKYPQILAEKVCDCTRDDFTMGIANNLFHRTHDGRQYELYLREVKQ